MNSSSSPAPVFVGEGLQERSFEDCLAEGLNPNPNPPGRICLPIDSAERLASMRGHIVRSQAFALRALSTEAD